MKALLAHHERDDGSMGAEMQTEEWMDAQARVACLAILELLRAPRHADKKLNSVSIPPIPVELEDIASHLLVVHEKGIHIGQPGNASYKEVLKNADVSIILDGWFEHFGSLFNIIAKQHQMPYERVAELLHSFQMELVQHLQHLRRLWEDHKQSSVTEEQLTPGEAWNSLRWEKPVVLSEGPIDFIQQIVLLSHVAGVRNETKLIMDNMHNRQVKLYKRLTPYGSPTHEE
ncbi:hypothetical protein H6770_03005 [Candidatus Peribacteria bacterium]|nr:hypothetical protein [Candidatus Peribacteria bacterium]